MSAKTGISWTDATWNPVRGCSRVSEGCRNCYAERVAARFCDPGQPYAGLIRRGIGGDRMGWSGDVRMMQGILGDPLRWKKPRRIFVNSMSDLFHEKLTNEQIAAVFGVMAACPQHTFQVLTKRSKRMLDWFKWIRGDVKMPRPFEWEVAQAAALRELSGHVETIAKWRPRWPLANVWIGVSVENQSAADERIPDLLLTPAAVRFLSCEPLIGPVDLPYAAFNGADSFGTLPGIGWAIAGCESGPGARRCDVAWLRALRDQCSAAGVPYFLKQARSFDSIEWTAVTEGEGSVRKSALLIELPYLDGVQHAAFPEAI